MWRLCLAAFTFMYSSIENFVIIYQHNSHQAEERRHQQQILLLVAGSGGSSPTTDRAGAATALDVQRIDGR